MITRLPSYQHEYVDHWSGDPALVQRPAALPDDASAESQAAYEKAVEDYERMLATARETGNWRPMTLEGQSPTQFVMGQVDRNIWRALDDRFRLPRGAPGWIGVNQLLGLLFRLSVQRIGIPGIEVVRRPDLQWSGWTMAQADIVTTLDTEYHPGIVGELGDEVFGRLRNGLSGK